MRTEMKLRLIITGLAGLLTMVLGFYWILYAQAKSRMAEGSFLILYIRGALWMGLGVLLWVYTGYCLTHRTGQKGRRAHT